MLEVPAVGARDHQHLVGGAAPVRADDHRTLVVDHHPVADLLLRLDGGAQQARRLEPTEAGLLVDDLTGHERDAEQRSEEHTSELQSLMRISYAVFSMKK